MRVVQKALETSSGLYYTQIEPPREYVAIPTIFKNLESGMKGLAILD
jgi:hypothetical protein